MAKIMRINGLEPHRRYSAFYSNRINTLPFIKDDGSHLINDVKICALAEFVLNMADKMSPFMKSHPKFGKYITLSCERIITSVNKLQ